MADDAGGGDANNEWCTAPGDDLNDGLSPATPKATVQAILADYVLDAGRCGAHRYRRVRAGRATSWLESGDEGSADLPLIFEASPYGVTLTRDVPSSYSVYGWWIDSPYVIVRTATSINYPGSCPKLHENRLRWRGLWLDEWNSHVSGSNCEVRRDRDFVPGGMESWSMALGRLSKTACFEAVLTGTAISILPVAVPLKRFATQRLRGIHFVAASMLTAAST